MKVLVCGGRDYTDFDKLEDVLNLIWRADGEFTIISGAAKGADTLAIQYAKKYNNPLKTYPANWDLHGKAAGIIRNQQMLDHEHPDLVVAFPGGRGTADMMRRARAAGVAVREIND
jgi:hypothetical protein